MINPDRISKLMEAFGMSQAELARRVGISQQSIWKIVNGVSRESVHLHKIASVLNSTTEFLSGEKDYPTVEHSVEEAEPADYLKPVLKDYDLDHDFASHDISPVSNDQKDNAVFDKFGLALIPELQLGYSMGGGNVIEMFEHIGVAPFKRDWLRPMMKGSFDDLFVARGEGDSMIPTMLDGDIVLIDTAQKDVLQQDRIWALSYGDLGMIKRVRKLPDGGYQINSDNPAVTAITAYDGEMHVIGRVIWVGRRM